MINKSVLGDQGPEGAISFFLSPSLRQRPENNSAVVVKVNSHQHIFIRERWKWQKKKKEMLNMKSTVSEMKNSLDALKAVSKESMNLMKGQQEGSKLNHKQEKIKK